MTGTSALPGPEEVWTLLRALAKHPAGGLVDQRLTLPLLREGPQSEAQRLIELYAPLCGAGRSGLAFSAGASRVGSFVVAHLGQSLDGRIGPPNGKPEPITGPEDMAHNHRMRALFDVVLVGAGTVCHDDPTLTVRLVEGANPIRVVVDPDRRLSQGYRIFNDDLAPTLLLCREERCVPGERHGRAEVIGVAGGCSPAAVIETLRQRNLPRIFI